MISYGNIHAHMLIPPEEPLLNREEKGGIDMQGSKLYVGNLSFDATDEDLKELFSSHGEVKEIKIIERKGFGFVEMSSPEEAEKAKEALNGKEFQGRTIRVDEARPPREKQRGRGGFQSRGRGRY